MAVTTTELLEKIKRAVTVPASQVRFSNPNLLSFADEETEATILPMLLSLRQEYLVKLKSVPVVANQSSYKLPYRAVGRTLREVKLATTNGVFIRDLAMVTIEDAHVYQFNAVGEPQACLVQGDKLVVLPTPSTATYNLQMYYELAPSKLVSTDEAGIVTAFDLTTGSVTIASTISGFVSGDIMDIVDSKSGCTVKGEDLTNLTVAGTALTFTAADLPSDMAVGDYICDSGNTPVVQLPQELHQSLVQAVVCRILEAQGDFEGLQAAEAKLEKKLAAASQLLTPRIEGKPQVVIHRNGLLNFRTATTRFRYIP